MRRMKNMLVYAGGVPLEKVLPVRVLFGIALLASCMTVSADEVQRLDPRLHVKVLYHDAQMLDFSRDVTVSQDELRLIAEVGRIIVDSGDIDEFAATITAQFAVQPLDQPPSDVLTIAMMHAGDGSYQVAGESLDAMGDWFADQMVAFRDGDLVLLQVDGLAAAQADADVQFDIEGECSMCDDFLMDAHL